MLRKTTIAFAENAPKRSSDLTLSRELRSTFVSFARNQLMQAVKTKFEQTPRKMLLSQNLMLQRLLLLVQWVAKIIIS